MGLRELLEDAKERPNRLLIRWREVRQEIRNEHKRARTFDERGVLLGIYKSVMDFVEATANFSPEALEIFKTERRQYYCLLLATEVVAEGGNVDPMKMKAVMRREIEAGRIASNNEFEKCTLDAVNKLRKLS
jgi:hypothetical protein